MLTKKPTLLTNEGLERLTKELEHLRTVGREEVAERLHRAFEDGQDDDFVDNAELEAARNAQAFLEGPAEARALWRALPENLPAAAIPAGVPCRGSRKRSRRDARA